MDSLYRFDPHFQMLLKNSLTLAEEKKISSEYLEDFAAKLISKELALKLMRFNPIMGMQSYDKRPMIQQERIARLAAETNNWKVFIKALLNIMNENVTKNTYSSTTSQELKTYINDLIKLDLNYHKILLGSNFKINDSKAHYYSSGSRIAKAYAELDSENQLLFQNEVEKIIGDPTLDGLNKLTFYNTYLDYKYFLKDSTKIELISKRINNLIPQLPKEIRSRFENPNRSCLLY